MLIYSLFLLLLSNAVTLKRDKSILYNRSFLVILSYSFLLTYSSLDPLINKNLGLFGNLFHTTMVSNTFHIFIFIICAIIVHLTSFYPRKM